MSEFYFKCRCGEKFTHDCKIAECPSCGNKLKKAGGDAGIFTVVIE